MADRSRSPAGRVSWSASAGAGGRDGAFLGLTGTAGSAVAFAGAIALMTLCPAIVILVYNIDSNFGGSISRFWSEYVTQAGVRGLWKLWPSLFSAKAREAWACFLGFGALQAVLQLVVPGKRFYGPVSPMGNVPQYKANGVQCFLVTGALFFAAVRANLIHPARLYDIFGELLGVCNVFALALCVYLTWKGLNMPSTSDSGTNGNLVYDFYWGTELYPRIGRLFDIKTWTNCRMGMMSWTFIVLCFAFKQLELSQAGLFSTGRVSNSMLVSVLLQAAYCFKFFLWETGYWKTMDIAHDRAGYYICWGCLNWVPGIYTSQALYLVRNPHDLSPSAAVAIAVGGLALIYINWEADDQRQRVRETNGQCTIWGSKPKCIRAKYTAADGEEKSSLLLASGWWGFARHMHYVPEILASVFWTLPAGFGHLMPWFYVVFLTILLLDRLYRDQERCRSKYGADWDRYCAAVPYMILPGVL